MLVPPTPPLHIVLVSPQIPPNTGNIARLCAVTGSRLVLVDPLGFSIEDKDLRRAGLDYWAHVFLARFASYPAYLDAFPNVPRTLFSARAEKSLFQVRFRPGHHLVFGSETEGLEQPILSGGSGEVCSIPMLAQRRSLNLSTAAGIVTYEALRQLSIQT
ncbi:MAG: tRNA (cytidine(34)-2'-O)-methyltransferase [Myxococcaceae bacterium]